MPAREIRRPPLGTCLLSAVWAADVDIRLKSMAPLYSLNRRPFSHGCTRELRAHLVAVIGFASRLSRPADKPHVLLIEGGCRSDLCCRQSDTPTH